MVGITFSPAERRKAKLRLAITGPSGSGKTYTSIIVGRGIVGQEGRIAVADTENQSAALYANVTPFDHCVITAPYEVEKYIRVIHAAEDAGYDLLILDSVTHVWKGSGGLLEMQEKEAEATRNKFSSWRNVSREYRLLIEAIVNSKIHIIVTLRSQTAYDMDNMDGGKRVPVKIGLKPEMREGFDYEFTTVLNMTSTVVGHLATVSKDRTGLFDKCGPFEPDMASGNALKNWLENGSTTPQPEPVPEFKHLVVEPERPKRPERVYTSAEVETIRKTYLEKGWDTSKILIAKIDDDVYDRELIDADFRMWNSMSTKTATETTKPSESAHQVADTALTPGQQPVAEPTGATPEPAPAPAAETQPNSTTSEFVCSKCGEPITKLQRDVSIMFVGVPRCKKCIGV